MGRSRDPFRTQPWRSSSVGRVKWSNAPVHLSANQRSTGTVKPCFGRDAMAGSTRRRTISRRTALSTPLWKRKRGGRRAANSHSF